MKKILFTAITVVIAMSLTVSAFAVTAGAETVASIQTQINKLEAQKKNMQGDNYDVSLLGATIVQSNPLIVYQDSNSLGGLMGLFGGKGTGGGYYWITNPAANSTSLGVVYAHIKIVSGSTTFTDSYGNIHTAQKAIEVASNTEQVKKIDQQISSLKSKIYNIESAAAAKKARFKTYSSKLTIYAGNAKNFNYNLTVSNTGNVRISLVSSNPKVATILSGERIKGLKSGTAVITATLMPSGATVKCNVTVKTRVQSLKLNAPDVKLAPGGTKQLTATTAPAKADDTVMWVSSDDSVASVSSKGKVTAYDNGSAYIFAYSKSGTARTHSIITVSGDAPGGLKKPIKTIAVERVKKHIHLAADSPAKDLSRFYKIGQDDNFVYVGNYSIKEFLSNKGYLDKFEPDGTLWRVNKKTRELSISLDSGETYTPIYFADSIALSQSDIVFTNAQSLTVSVTLSPKPPAEYSVVSASVSDKSVVGVNTTNEKIYITPISAGTATVKIYVNGGAKYKGLEKTIKVTVPKNILATGNNNNIAYEVSTTSGYVPELPYVASTTSYEESTTYDYIPALQYDAVAVS